MVGCPKVDEAWRDWLVANHHRIGTLDLTATDDTDLAFLQTAIGNRRIVMLGESSHLVNEFDQAKARVIRYLHERMGFDVLVFESSLYSCFRVNEEMANLTPRDAMHDSVYHIWGCQPTEDLFGYLKGTKSTAHPMILGGVDPQESSITGNPLQDSSQQLQALIAPLDPTYATSVASNEQAFLQQANTYNSDWVFANRDVLTQEYTQLLAWLDTHMDVLVAANPSRPLWPKLARQFIWSRLQLIAEMCTDLNPSYLIRDRAMAANLDFLFQAYPDKKFIVWAHNYHIEKDREGVQSEDLPGMVNMGEIIHQEHPDDAYVIGLYMLRGTTQYLDGTEVKIRLPLPDSLEAVLYTARRNQGFVDLLSAPTEGGTQWLDQSVPTWEWGVTPEHQILRQQYDGILWVDTVHPPIYQ